jgi:hypothetical protein
LKQFLTDFDEFSLKAAALLLETIEKMFGLEIEEKSIMTFAYYFLNLFLWSDIGL